MNARCRRIFFSRKKVNIDLCDLLDDCLLDSFGSKSSMIWFARELDQEDQKKKRYDVCRYPAFRVVLSLSKKEPWKPSKHAKMYGRLYIYTVYTILLTHTYICIHTVYTNYISLNIIYVHYIYIHTLYISIYTIYVHYVEFVRAACDVLPRVRQRIEMQESCQSFLSISLVEVNIDPG